MFIFLDDERVPSDVTWTEIPRVNNWMIVRSYDAFKSFIDSIEMITHVSFDHDLADIHYGGDYSDEKTGFNCAKYLVDWCMDNDRPLPKWTVHSMNPVGAQNINSYLANFLRVRGY